MKAYPSISTQVDFSLPYWIFDKIDGSNLRAEFSSKRGFYKFGSRTQLLTPDQEALWPAAARIESLEAQVRPVIERLRAPRVVCFFEWAGPNSFAGSHTDPAQAMELFLLDVDVYQKGRLAPEQVLALANEAGIATPALLHKGRIDADFLDLVRKGLVDGMGQEGIVGKGPVLRSVGGPCMFKHKRESWLERLKQRCGDDEALFRQLA